MGRKVKLVIAASIGVAAVAAVRYVRNNREMLHNAVTAQGQHALERLRTRQDRLPRMRGTISDYLIAARAGAPSERLIMLHASDNAWPVDSTAKCPTNGAGEFVVETAAATFALAPVGLDSYRVNAYTNAAGTMWGGRCLPAELRKPNINYQVAIGIVAEKHLNDPADPTTQPGTH